MAQTGTTGEFSVTQFFPDGMVMPDYGFRAHHVGGRAADGEAVFKMLSDETRKVDDHATLLKLRDITRGILSQEMLDGAIGKFREAAGQKLEGNPA